MTSTIPYLFIPADTNQPIRTIQINADPVQMITQTRGWLGGQVEDLDIVYSQDEMLQMLGIPGGTPIGKEFITYEVLLSNLGPCNTRASDLLIRENTRGPVLLMIPRYIKGKVHSSIIGHEQPTESRLRTDDFRKQRAMWNNLSKEFVKMYVT